MASVSVWVLISGLQARHSSLQASTESSRVQASALHIFFTLTTWSCSAWEHGKMPDGRFSIYAYRYFSDVFVVRIGFEH
jgi:hypothetical protein